MSWCEHCEAEHDGESCPVCGGPMLLEIDPEHMPEARADWSFSVHHPDDPEWPCAPGGEPEGAVYLIGCTDFPSYEEVLVARLRAAGIPVVEQYPKAGGLGKIYNGFSGYGVDLYVPKSRLAEARGLLKPVEETGSRPDEEEGI